MNKKILFPLLSCVCGLAVCLSVSCQTAAPAAESAQTPSQESIHDLILSGYSSEAKEMFTVKTDINIRDEQGNTPLHAAAKVNDPELASFLIFRGADIETVNSAGDTPLLTAVKSGASDVAKTLINSGADIFAADSAGNTALSLAGSRSGGFIGLFINQKTGKLKNAEGKTIVHLFTEEKNEQAIDMCIAAGLPLSEKDNYGVTPLAAAYSHDNDVKSIGIAAKLILADAEPVRGSYSYFEDAVKTRNPGLRFEDGQTPLHFAAIRGQTGIAEYFLSRGASPQAKDASGSTPLHEAVRYGHTDIVRLLLTNGADPNAKDITGNTPLIIVIPQAPRSEIFDLLLTYGADPNAKDMYGDTPLHIAAMVGMDTDIITKLIAAGADSNERNKKGLTPLALAIDRYWTHQVAFYISQGADIHAGDIDGNTPLTRSFSADRKMLQMIITEHTVASRDSFGNTPLHIAVISHADPAVVQYLLEKNADVNARNRSGETPLYIAVKDNLRATGEILLARGADVFSANTDDDSPLRLALARGGDTRDWILTSEVIRASDGIGNTPLHYAAEWRLDDAVRFILEKGGNANAKNANGETPLFNAVKADSPSTVQLLIDMKSAKDARDYLGNTPLHACVRWSSVNAAGTLIRNGADINAQNISGKTVLSEAARNGKTEMVSLLLDSNANINAADATGKTVLIDAIQGGKTDIVRLLLQRGASPAIQEMYGRNAYHEAAESGNIEMITLIQNAGGNPLSRDSYGRTPFSLVLNQPQEIISSVLGTDINLIDSDGNTPVHIAVTDKAPTEILQMLVDKKYPVNRRNSVGVTPVLIAAQENLTDQTRILLMAGADPFIADNAGDSAVSIALQGQNELLTVIVQTAGTKTDIAGEGILHYAARYADEATMNRLLAMGLDRTSRNISGETPYDVAVRWQRPQISALLK